MSIIKNQFYGVSILIIHPENCSIQIALVKTLNRFPYCTESRNILSYYTESRNVLSNCTGLNVPNRTTFRQVVAMKEESGSHFPLPMELKKRRINGNDRFSCKEN